LYIKLDAVATSIDALFEGCQSVFGSPFPSASMGNNARAVNDIRIGTGSQMQTASERGEYEQE
jgi:hypothetical protein